MKIWVTRPACSNEALIPALERAGHQPIVAPLLSYQPLQIDLMAPDQFCGLIVTSQNSLRALAENFLHLEQKPQQTERYASGQDGLSLRRVYLNLPLIAVGGATATRAKALGFTDVMVGGGSASTLPGMIHEHFQNSQKPLLQLTGDQKAFDLKACLERYSPPVEIIEQQIYLMSEAKELPASLVSALREEKLEAVALMSPRTAGVYKSLIKKYDLGDKINALYHFLWSEKVAKNLETLNIKNKDICPETTIECLLERLNRVNSEINKSQS